jgi:hypothetical protein
MERKETCQGCMYDSLGQRAHMGYGGCLSDDVDDFVIFYDLEKNSNNYLPVYINSIKYYYSLYSKYLHNAQGQIICHYNFEKGTLHPINNIP